MFSSLQFKNFRGFSDLSLTNLQRVNLVVGRNNAGKTSFLEGVLLLCNTKHINEMPGLLRPRAGQPQKRYFKWLLRDQATQENATLSGSDDGRRLSVILTGDKRFNPSGTTRVYNSQDLGVLVPDNQAVRQCSVISVQYDSPDNLVKQLALAVKRRGGEEQIESLLRKVDDRVRKVRIEPGDDGNHVMLDVGLSEMIPASQAGQGLYRLVGMFSELIGESPACCIIDEIENGIHHSILEQVWTGIATAASQLNIQIFATTHSQECIEAAHAAFAKRETYDFAITQLFRVEQKVQGRVLDRKHIEAAIAGEIDLR